MRVRIRSIQLFAVTLFACSSAELAQGAGAGSKNFLADTSTTFVLENVRLIDGTGAPARERLTIIIDKGRIAALGKNRVVTVPAGARRIDLSGHTVLPGLVMMHEHINYFSGAYVWDAQPGTVPKLLLAGRLAKAGAPFFIARVKTPWTAPGDLLRSREQCPRAPFTSTTPQPASPSPPPSSRR